MALGDVAPLAARHAASKRPSGLRGRPAAATGTDPHRPGPHRRCGPRSGAAAAAAFCVLVYALSPRTCTPRSTFTGEPRGTVGVGAGVLADDLAELVRVAGVLRRGDQHATGGLHLAPGFGLGHPDETRNGAAGAGGDDVSCPRPPGTDRDVDLRVGGQHRTGRGSWVVDRAGGRIVGRLRSRGSCRPACSRPPSRGSSGLRECAVPIRAGTLAQRRPPTVRSTGVSFGTDVPGGVLWSVTLHLRVVRTRRRERPSSPCPRLQPACDEMAAGLGQVLAHQVGDVADVQRSGPPPCPRPAPGCRPVRGCRASEPVGVVGGLHLVGADARDHGLRREQALPPSRGGPST